MAITLRVEDGDPVLLLREAIEMLQEADLDPVMQIQMVEVRRRNYGAYIRIEVDDAR